MLFALIPLLGSFSAIFQLFISPVNIVLASFAFAEACPVIAVASPLVLAILLFLTITSIRTFVCAAFLLANISLVGNVIHLPHTKYETDSHTKFNISFIIVSSNVWKVLNSGLVKNSSTASSIAVVTSSDSAFSLSSIHSLAAKLVQVAVHLVPVCCFVNSFLNHAKAPEPISTA